MSSIMFPDLLGTIAKASAIEQNQSQRDWLDEDRAAKKAAGVLVPQALGGDKDALGKIGTLHPDTALKLAPLLERLDANKRAKVKEDSEFITSNGMAILNAPPEQQPQIYARVRQEAQASGRDVSQWPTTYDPGWVKFNVDKAMPFSEHFKRSGEGVTFAPAAGGAPGAPAPAGGVSSNNIGNVRPVGGGPQSGFQQPASFDDGVRLAVNNVKAYPAKFNGGQPMSLMQIGARWAPVGDGANDPAQWARNVASIGGLDPNKPLDFNDPTTAAAFARGVHGAEHGANKILPPERYAQAITGGAAPPGIAQGSDMPAADASGTPLPPAQQALAPLRGLQIPPGARVALQGGVPIVKDGNVLYLDANGGWGAAPLPTRAAPKERQLPAGYEENPEGGGLRPIVGGPADPARQRAERIPPGYRLAPDGQTLEFIPGGPADPAIAKKASPMTEGQANAALYADRMRAAEKVIIANQSEGQSAVGKGLEMVPGGNYLQSEGYQLYEQARRDFINAVLRRESGAVISDQEFANAEKQYFPRPGDKPDVLKQKADNRRIALEGISRAAGSTYKAASEDAPAATPAPVPQTPAPKGADRGKMLFDARDAISKGAPRDKVIERLKANGITEEP